MNNFGLTQELKTSSPLSLGDLSGGSNGAAPSGLVGPRVFKDLSARTKSYRAAFYPNKPEVHGDSECIAGDVCDFQHHQAAIKGLDFFIHLASLPIHYASKEVAIKILAIEMGTLQLAWAVHGENSEREKQNKEPMRVIVYNSTAALLMEKQIQWLESKEESKKIAADLRQWLDDAADIFINLTKSHSQGHAAVSLIACAMSCVDSTQAIRGEKIDGPPIKPLTAIIDQLDQLKEAHPEFRALQKFDYYSFFKLLTISSLRKLAEDGIVTNTIAIQPVSILAEGLQAKDDPSFTASMTMRLLLTEEERLVEPVAKKEKDQIWGDRNLDFIPLEQLLEIQTNLILLPANDLLENLKVVVLPGAKISQEDAYSKYILPITRKFLVDYLGRDGGEVGKHLRVIPNPNALESVTRNVPPFIDPLIAEVHTFGKEVLPKLCISIIFNIINDYLARRGANLLPEDAKQLVFNWFKEDEARLEKASLPKSGYGEPRD